MTLTIRPDPQEPAGGFAFLQMPHKSLGAGPVSVAVREVYGGRWLGPVQEGGKVTVGDANWQGDRHDFGPYPVQSHDGADWLRIGPEIVNKIEEYTPLQVVVGPHEVDVTWPDDVPPRAGAAVLGGLHATARAPSPETDQALVGKPKDPVPEPDPVPQAPPAPVNEDPPKRRPMGALLLVIFLIAGLVAVWVLFPRDDPDTSQQAVAPNTCTRAAITALEGFTAKELAIRACGATLSADTVLAIVETGARADDPAALLLFGTLYDGAELDARIETVIGLGFDHDAARAAEYYSRAAAAGSDVARTRLGVTCTQLAASGNTLSKGAYDDFCQ